MTLPSNYGQTHKQETTVFFLIAVRFMVSSLLKRLIDGALLMRRFSCARQPPFCGCLVACMVVTRVCRATARNRHTVARARRPGDQDQAAAQRRPGNSNPATPDGRAGSQEQLARFREISGRLLSGAVRTAHSQFRSLRCRWMVAVHGIKSGSAVGAC